MEQKLRLVDGNIKVVIAYNDLDINKGSDYLPGGNMSAI